jgi:hypothetical protein
MERVALGVAAMLPDLLLAASPGRAGEPVLSEYPPPIVVHWHDPQGALPFAAEEIGRELQAMFAGAGLELEFRVAPTSAVASENRRRSAARSSTRHAFADVKRFIEGRTAGLRIAGNGPS